MNMSGTRPVASYRNRLGYHSGLLAGICCMVATFMFIGHLTTKDRIAEALKQDELNMLSQVIPAHLYDNDLLGNKIKVVDLVNTEDVRMVYVGTQSDFPSAYALPAEISGYSGIIKLIIGLKPNGKIIGVRTISHTETPGLGDKIEIARDDWIRIFDGKSLSNTSAKFWAVKKDGGEIDQFSGATITPRAVVNGVRQSLEFYQNNLAQFKLTLSGEPERAKPEGSLFTNKNDNTSSDTPQINKDSLGDNKQ